MVIEKIINNNVVSSRDEAGFETVVMGRGLGFGKKKGEKIEEDKIDKIFRIEDKDSLKKFKKLIADLPIEYLQVSTDIISYAKKKLGVQLNQNVYLTLTDHISFAIERFKQGMLFNNALNHEIKRFYPLEYQIGEYSLDFIEKNLNIRLPEDEASSIAIHLLNAELHIEVKDAMKIIILMRDILGKLNEEIAALNNDCIEKDSFMSFLKLLCLRLMTEKPQKEDGDPLLLNFVKQNDEKLFSLIEKIGVYIFEKYGCTVTEEEKLYFTLQIKRVYDLFK